MISLLKNYGISFTDNNEPYAMRMYNYGEVANCLQFYLHFQYFIKILLFLVHDTR